MEEILTEEISTTPHKRSKKKMIIIIVIAAIVLGLAGSIIYANSEEKSLKDLATQLVTDKCILLTDGEARVEDVDMQTVISREVNGSTIYTLKGTYKLKGPHAEKLSGNFQIEVEKLDSHAWNVIDVTVYAPGLD